MLPVPRSELAQRLVRRVCPDCRQQYTPTDDELRELGYSLASFKAEFGTDRIYKSVGCPACNRNGYRGRTGIYEFLPVDEEVRQLILKNVDSGTIKKSACGMPKMTRNIATNTTGIIATNHSAAGRPKMSRRANPI